MEFLLGLLSIATGILTILQINANTRQKRVDERLAKEANEKQELVNQLAMANNNAELFKSLVEMNAKMVSNMEKMGDRLDKNTDAHYINTQLANEKIGKLDDTIGASVTEQKKAIEHLGKIDKTISQASFDTNSQIERLGLDIRNLVKNVNDQLTTIKGLVETRHEAEGETLKRINEITDRFQEDVNNVNELIPLLRQIADDCKEDKSKDDKPKIEVLPKETDNEEKEDIAS